MCVVRQRHETVNWRMKQCQILKGVFRHDINLHHIAFAAAAVVTQDAISHREPLFQVDYTDNLDVSDDEEEPVDNDTDVEDGQDGTNEEEEHDDSTAVEDTDNDTNENEDFFEACMMKLLILTIKKCRLLLHLH